MSSCSTRRPATREIWFDSDWGDTGSRVKIATFDNITTLAELNEITASDIVVYNNPQGSDTGAAALVGGARGPAAAT